MATVGSFALRGVLSQLTPDIFPAIPHISSTIPKHTKDKTALNSNYLFKIPCIAIALVARGFAGKLSSREFHWNKHYIPGRQLMTAAGIQQRWPGRWEHFCDQLMPGFRMLQAQVLQRGNTDLSNHEKDCLAQMQLLAYLLEVSLRDSGVLLHQQPNARVWKDLSIFSDPASNWMTWHSTQLQPAVLQLQQQAEKVHYSIISHSSSSKTVMGEALDVMGWQQAQAQAMQQARDLHHKMVDLLDGTAMPAAVVTIQPAVPVEQSLRLCIC